MRDKFVCVRITRMNGVDLNRFQFDYDVTWNSFFLDSDLNVYSRYGGRDGGDPEARLSTPSLLKTMQEVLDAHQTATTAHSTAKKKLIQPVKSQAFRPNDIPLLRKNHRGCVHCHQIKEYGLLQSYADGDFDRSLLFRWPLPENLGIEIDHQHGFKIKRVTSIAEKSGLEIGDVIRNVDGIPTRSEYDIRWALDRSSGEQLEVTVERRGQSQQIRLAVGKNWKRTDLGWRKSIRSVPISFAMRGYPLVRSQRTKMGLPRTGLAIKVVSVRGTGFSTNMGLQKLDIIVGLAGDHPNRTLSEFKSDLLSRYQPGDEVTLTVVREGKRVELKGRFPDWFSEQQTVP